MEKTYYIEIEAQGNAELIVKVRAKDLSEAEGKAAKAYLASRDLYPMNLEDARMTAEEEGIIVVDEDGSEIDLDDEEDEEDEEDE